MISNGSRNQIHSRQYSSMRRFQRVETMCSNNIAGDVDDDDSSGCYAIAAIGNERTLNEALVQEVCDRML